MVGYWVLCRLGRRSMLVGRLVRSTYWPTIAIVVFLASRLLMQPGGADGWRGPVLRALTLAVIGSFGWLAAMLLQVVADAALGRFRVDVQDNLTARRVHTQVTVIRRVGLAVVVMVTIGTMLVTFPQARAAGASILASAGLAGVIAALAAQSILGNTFAGLQLAFGNALRIDDVVVVRGEWGRVEEMTLGYVVIKIWDERRLILPSSYFTTTPFENWTRTDASVLGTVMIDVDWSVSVRQLRDAARDIVEEHRDGWWDGRVCGVQITDATGGTIEARVLVSSSNSSALWDLRCLVRERLVDWIQQHHPAVRPRVRAELSPLDPPGHDRGAGKDPAPGS
ncbi:MAG: mechanosensitive ion channel [Dactylosporangium sp.]|nr:mechanosensitive ion channel family protein [Dactylosporangium sp.]NNJ62082.1 mechanosensitive ion channel [Dactylosporangium sp.]